MRKYFFKINLIFFCVLFIIPFIVFAAPKNITDIINLLIGIIKQAGILVVALALLFFFWGLSKFILQAGSEDGRKEGRNIMLWGIIALFIMISVWGIVAVLDNTFFGGSSGNTNIPSSYKQKLKIDRDPFDPLPDQKSINI